MDIPLSLLHPALRIMALSHSPASTKGIPLPQSYPQRSPQAPLTYGVKLIEAVVKQLVVG